MNQREALGRLAGKVKAAFGRCRLVWLVILAGLLLLLFPLGDEEGGEVPADTETVSFDLEATETKLAQALSQIDGAGEVTVVLTVSSTPRRLLAQDTQEKGTEDTTETVVLSKGSSTQETVTIQEVYPQYQGALVVCPGGDDPAVRLGLTQAVSALTGLGADKIVIRKGT
jgi:stage III sporulation protein AG